MSDAHKTVFISYRREVSSFIARAIFQDLRKHNYDVFMDVENIDSGTFDTVILNQIAARTHFIVILTPGTEKRLAEPDDWLRREIEHAIKLERNIVPILANNFDFHDAEQYLKDELKQLQRYNGIHLHHDYFDAAMEKLRGRFLKVPEHMSITQATGPAVEDVQRKIDSIAELPTPTKAQLDAEDYLDRGLKKYNEKEYSLAIKDYDKAIELNPEYVDAYNNRGVAYDNLGEYKRAIKDYDKAIELNPEYALAYYNRGLAYKLLKDTKKAIFDFLKFLEIGTDADLIKDAKASLKKLGVKV